MEIEPSAHKCPPYRNKTLLIAANNCAEANIKVFWSSRFMPNFSTLLYYFFPGLSVGFLASGKLLRK